MNTVKIGDKAPPLQVSEWVLGGPVSLNQLMGKVILIEVFQINCPGCFLYSIPQSVDLYQRYHDKNLAVIGIATAFEDFDINTLDNLKLLATQSKLVGEPLHVLDSYNKLINGCLPFHIPFPLAMDEIEKTDEKITDQKIQALIDQSVPDFENRNTEQQWIIYKQALNYLQTQYYQPQTFRTYALQGTPSHIVIDQQGNLRACEFGHFTELEWLVTSLLAS